MNFQTERVKLKDIAKIERAKRGVRYPPCVLIDSLSDDGLARFHDGEGEVSPKDYVVTPYELSPYYLALLCEAEIKKFTRKRKAGLNLPTYAVRQLEVSVHTDKAAQELLIQLKRTLESLTRAQRRMAEIYPLIYGGGQRFTEDKE